MIAMKFTIELDIGLSFRLRPDIWQAWRDAQQP